ncbi:MAG: hypothetical protein GY887_06625, partial [Halieaceae bacterium]|nr:hypothetical protein [Halieaceae bacterium]
MAAATPFFFYLIAAIILIVLELLVFQLSVFWLLFLGAGALAAAAVAFVYQDAGWILTTAVFVLSTAAIAFIAYRPLKRWQSRPGKMPGNDAIGQQVVVLSDIGPGAAGTVQWSGTDWRAELEASTDVVLAKGSTATI